VEFQWCSGPHHVDPKSSGLPGTVAATPDTRPVDGLKIFFDERLLGVDEIRFGLWAGVAVLSKNGRPLRYNL